MAIQLKAKDCSKFDELKPSSQQKNRSKIIEELIKRSDGSFLKLTNREVKEALVYYDYEIKDWLANRFVGKINFKYLKSDVHVDIQPRFGSIFLTKMLEYIYNIQLPKSFSDQVNCEEFWIKELIGIIWLKQLGDANKFGLPRVKKKEHHRGLTIKGRLNIKKSVKPYFNNKQVVSDFSSKYFDETISQILFQTYRILFQNFITKPSDSAQDAISHLLRQDLLLRKVTISEYVKIKYQSIYLPFKRVVDLSWRIINNKSVFFQSNSGSNDSFGIFLDMSEVWELYLARILKENLSDWEVLTQESELLYQNNFFKRSIIPDLILRKGKKIAVFDAKWKKMNFESNDLDRTDFFQINTYISYYNNNSEYDVIVGGLLYPLETDVDKSKSHSNQWIGNDNVKFIVDGVNIPNPKDQDFSKALMNNEIDFVNRLKCLLDKRETQP